MWPSVTNVTSVTNGVTKKWTTFYILIKPTDGKM